MVVTSSADVVAFNGQCTLREAIQNHNTKSQVNPDCPVGRQKNVIDFSFGGTITLGSELPAVQNKLTIDGASAITIDGASAARIMETSGAATLTLLNVTLAHGSASGDGGGVLNTGGTLKVNNVTFSNNSATGSGGGVYSPGGSLLVIDSTFDQNSAVSGGGLSGINVTISGTSFTNNHASQYGGGLYTFAMTMTDSTVSSNTAGFGFGGLATGGPGVLKQSTIESNQAPLGAGAVIQQAGGTQFRLEGDTIHGNTAACPGGGLVTFFSDSSSSVLLKNSTIDGNSTTNGSCGPGGAGLLNQGPGMLTIANSTIANNSSASDRGGGIYNSGNLALFNVTISGNSVSGAAGTGGIYDDNAGGYGLTTFANTIVAENTDGNDADCGGTGGFTSNGNNLAGDATCNLIASGDQPSTDPDLGALGTNGGPTETMLPSSTSPALDAASDSTCRARPVSKRDQRGIKRPQGSHCDIGSVEREVV
jgi:CSLREA domain-containing protein